MCGHVTGDSGGGAFVLERMSPPPHVTCCRVSVWAGGRHTVAVCETPEAEASYVLRGTGGGADCIRSLEGLPIVHASVAGGKVVAITRGGCASNASEQDSNVAESHDE